MRGIILLIFFVCSLPACFVRPFYGIVLWMIVAFLNPQGYMWGFASYPVALAIAIPTLIGLVVFERDWFSRIASRESILLGILWLWFTVTTLVSISSPDLVHHAADTWSKWGLVSKILLMTLATMAVVRTGKQLRTLMLVIAGCFGVFVLKTLPFMIATGGQFRVYGPENSMIADNNDFGLALDMTLPVFFFLAQSETHPWLKRFFGFLTLITVPAILFTYSRGALSGLLVVLALMIVRSRQRLLLIPTLALGVIVTLAFAPEAWQKRMNLTGGDVVDASARSRLNAWSFCWALASDHPITGGGFATFTPELFRRYAPNVLDVHNSHSIYFGVLAEHGFVGLILYATLIGSCFLTTGRVLKFARIHEDQTAIHYANMFRLSIIGFLISGMFLSRAYFDYFFTIVAAVAILRRVCEIEWGQTEEIDMEEEVLA